VGDAGAVEGGGVGQALCAPLPDFMAFVICAASALRYDASIVNTLPGSRAVRGRNA
jgi:hypothetical protein